VETARTEGATAKKEVAKVAKVEKAPPKQRGAQRSPRVVKVRALTANRGAAVVGVAPPDARQAVVEEAAATSTEAVAEPALTVAVAAALARAMSRPA
jgi:hypothetical protein